VMHIALCAVVLQSKMICALTFKVCSSYSRNHMHCSLQLLANYMTGLFVYKKKCN